MVFFLAVIAGDLGNVSLLAYLLFGGNGIGSGNRGTVFLLIPLGPM